MRTLTAILLIAVAAPAAPALAQPGGEQKQVRKEARAGNVLPLRHAEANGTVPQVLGMLASL